MSCDQCGALAPTTYVEMHHNVGMLIARRVGSTVGHLCRKCVWKAFTDHTLKNVVLGWWGLISFFATLYFLLNNVITLISALNTLRGEHQRLEPPRKPKAAAADDPEEHLEPFSHTIRIRLEDGDTVDDISGDMAEVAAVSNAQAREFVERLRARD